MPGSTDAMQPCPDHGESSYKGSGQLKRMKAVITGGDSGIGRAVAIAFARECADARAPGKLEGEAPEQRMVKEIGEELGYHINRLERLFALYMSPAEVMEKINFLPYSPADQVPSCGGLAEEGKDIEVVEIGLKRAHEMICTGEIIDAKTVILLQHLGHRFTGSV
jgi:8-oxo-dGTP pyrophosphatase MutT (NUDIX family)